MLKDWNKLEVPAGEEVENRLKAAREMLLKQQVMMKEKKLPVIVLFEGWGAAGKGSVLGKVIKNIDPRFFKVAVMDEPTEGREQKAISLQAFCKNSRSRKVCFYGQRLDVRGYKAEAEW